MEIKITRACVKELVNDCCLTPTQQFVSYIMVKLRPFSMK